MKRIGIWGFGCVGRSVAHYLIRSKQAPATIIEQRIATDEEVAFCAEFSILWIVQTAEQLEQFWAEHDCIVVSPGIDSRAWAQRFPEKVTSELDIFADAFAVRQRAVPLIAITGTVGKTTITHLTGVLAQSLGKNVFVGGNIGVGMLDAVDDESIDLFVLEVSSFQLEYAQRFHPTLAVFTNIFENHLDRHGSLDEYRAAKLRVFACQTESDCAIVPDSLLPYLPSLRAHILTVGQDAPAEYQFSDRGIARCGLLLVPIADVPAQSYLANWAYLVAIGTLLGISPHEVCARLRSVLLPDHRCMVVATINGVTYYDDSKSTIIEATRAAVQSLASARTILLLGGVSKGVDRTRALATFPKNGLTVVPFGAEANALHGACIMNGIVSEEPCVNLEEAVERSFSIAQPGDVVLLSPGGASFDLFKNYTARGKRFKEILDRLQQGCDTVGA